MRRATRAMTPGPFVPRRIKAIQSMAWADAKAQIAIVKQSLADTESFWAANKKDDAVSRLPAFEARGVSSHVLPGLQGPADLFAYNVVPQRSLFSRMVLKI
jgi:hypothetical protein